MDAIFEYPTALGRLVIAEKDAAICLVTFKELGIALPRMPLRPTALLNTCANQMMEFLAGKRNVFDVPYILTGSAFDREVYEGILRIPYAQMRTFQELAQSIGHPKSARSVSISCARTPLLGIIPVHRVVLAHERAPQNRWEALLSHMREVEARG